MTTVTLYHNPRCSKSRAALALLQVRDIKTEIIPYLVRPLDRTQIQTLMSQLGITSVRGMIRTREPEYTTLGLARADEDTLINALVANPVLLERPIAVLGDKAAIGRPLENIEALLDAPCPA